MRLRNIKLSGFKSFVDPTTLNMPGNLIGIVGPNGCGKSNIIDAVTWVMGESSAKHLRGESMTDVIFNGSTARQPVGQASVELCFDNTEGKAGGEYAKYNELSIKRVVNRDAVSTYYLNGTRCRRRDITSIFLGTGLGPRSYSIIEQGMISRLIEAKPEDLRSFIEEAAGISKYRERRRETENRIRHTRENLERLNDIQEELIKQLAHLERQAKAAQKFKELKEQERKLQAELLALKWKSYKQKTEDDERVTSEAQNRLEQGVAELRAIESDIEQHRVAINESNEGFNVVQSAHFQLGADISQLEQSIKHTREQIETAELEITKMQDELQKAKQQYESDQNSMRTLEQEFAELQPRLHGSRNESDKAYEFLNDSEQAMQAWQSEWDRFNDSALETEARLQKSKSREEFLSDALEESQHRYQQLQTEYDELDTAALKQHIAELAPNLEQSESELKEKREHLENQRQDLQHNRQQLQTMQADHEVLRNDFQQKIIRKDTLEGLQKNVMGQDDDDLQQWLEEHDLQEQPRLAQVLKVESEWASALEVVLGQHLQAVYLGEKTLDDIISEWESANSPGFWNDLGAATNNGVENVSLADKVSQPESLKAYLSSIYLADSRQDAYALSKNLKAHESVITQDGMWLGQCWLKSAMHEQNQEGILEREQELQSLRIDIEQQDQRLHTSQSELNNKKDSLQQQESRIDELMKDIQSQQERFSTQQAELLKEEGKLEEMESRSERLQSELDELQQQTSNYRSEIEEILSTLQSSEDEKNKMDEHKQELIALRQQHQSSLEQARSRWQTTHEESHGIALKLEAITSQKASLEQTIKRTEMQEQTLSQRLEELQLQLTKRKEPLAGMQGSLEEKLAEKVESEKKVGAAREALQTLENAMRASEKARHESESKIQDLRDAVEKLRLKSQESIIRLQTTEEQLQALEKKPEEVLASLSEDANINEWTSQLESTERKITRLGPINLAAIDEHKQLSERKEYLDSQESDLKEALETLETAIRKIDKETRSRFKETFDLLNSNLKELFPQLVGGGSAYLELTGDDLLDTGVTIMARPPGKKNASIHLLSGGEKAMTAVALVFSIFKLNPAPFCILDEVDAPLDDNNTIRFSEMVKNMSSEVQFLFITHNKITMEIAQQLLGVTMNEPGVSRLVSVDVDAAVEMAASA